MTSQASWKFILDIGTFCGRQLPPSVRGFRTSGRPVPGGDPMPQRSHRIRRHSHSRKGSASNMLANTETGKAGPHIPPTMPCMSVSEGYHTAHATKEQPKKLAAHRKLANRRAASSARRTGVPKRTSVSEPSYDHDFNAFGSLERSEKLLVRTWLPSLYLAQ